MKKLFFLLLIMFPALAMAQGHKGEVDECAPMKNGKVCYRDTVHVNDMSQDQIFEVINQIHSDGMDMVTLSFIEADDDLPAAISLVASKDNDKVEIDYEEIESC